jgi:toxin ParE1/3/4
MKVRFSPRAVADLTGIADYLAARNRQAARGVEGRIREVLDRLTEFPAMGRTLAQRPAVRVMPLGRYPYLNFYTAVDEELLVLHIRHGAQKPLGPAEL